MLRFFTLTYAIAWTCFFGAAMLDLGNLETPLLLLGTFTPGLVAIALMAYEGGHTAIDAMLRRLVDGQVAARWYVLAFSYMATLKLAAAVAHRLVAGFWPEFGTTPWFVIPFAILLSTPVQAGEEIGWRGYALPKLEQRFGLVWASLILGLIWGVWHLPLFFVQGLGHYGQSFPLFGVGTIVLSVALAWLYANTNGSLLLSMLMHSAINQSVDIVPTRLAVPAPNPLTAIDTSPITLLFVAALVLSAGYFLVRMAQREKESGNLQGRLAGSL